MLLLGEHPDHIDKMANRLKELSKFLVSGFIDDLPKRELNHIEDLYHDSDSNTLFYLVSGTIQVESNERIVYYYEDGDIVGLQNTLDIQSPRLTSPDPVTLIAIDKNKFAEHVNNKPQWAQYLLILSAFFTDAYSRLAQIHAIPQTGFLTFKSGDTIIQEGDSSNDVYTLLTGHAQAFINGVQVGDIYSEEIFGAMAAFTNSPRSATVKASEECQVLAVPKDQFVNLIQYHPKTCVSLIESMARKIKSLNEMITA
ncbi:cyclic nucleotide-binding domain-containing protein [Litoribacillus peritrichatus]|uniref:cAMP-binding protein CbpA n=1 Tax=Litoribacillus peritrichatus TaxID=718191 RepID=A0ABP7MSB0_9GAMM